MNEVPFAKISCTFHRFFDKNDFFWLSTAKGKILLDERCKIFKGKHVMSKKQYTICAFIYLTEKIKSFANLIQFGAQLDSKFSTKEKLH